MPYSLTNNLLAILGWVCLLSILIPYLLYPILIYGCSMLARRRQSPSVEQDELPEITVVVAAYNAERVIEQRIRNVQQSCYPANKWRMVVVSDGSTDETVQRARSMDDPRVVVIVMPERSGKARAIERAMREVRTEVVVFTDVTASFHEKTLSNLGRHFVDPSVGIVSGELQIVDDRGTHVEGIYWKIEAAVRRAEARLGILTGTSGAVYAMRRSHYVPTKRPTINDDMVLPVLAAAKSGCVFVQDPEAIAQIYSVKTKGTDLRRRRRISRGIWQSLPVLIPAFLEIGLGTSLAFVGHKLLRWLCPLSLIGFLISSLLLSSIPTYRLFAAAQIAFYGIAFAGYLLHRQADGQSNPSSLWRRVFSNLESSRVGIFLQLSAAFVTMNVGVLSGFFQWLYEPTKVIWDPSERPILVTSLKSPEGSLR